MKCDGTHAETRFRLSPKWMSPFKSAGASVQSTAGSQGVLSGSNAGYTTFRGSVRVMPTHSIRQFPLHFPSRASPCAIRYQTHSTSPSYTVSPSPTPAHIFYLPFFNTAAKKIFLGSRGRQLPPCPPCRPTTQFSLLCLCDPEVPPRLLTVPFGSH